MIRRILKQNMSKTLTDKDIDMVMAMTDADIKFNKIKFNRLTPAVETMNIALRCLRTYERCLS